MPTIDYIEVCLNGDWIANAISLEHAIYIVTQAESDSDDKASFTDYTFTKKTVLLGEIHLAVIPFTTPIDK